MEIDKLLNERIFFKLIDFIKTPYFFGLWLIVFLLLYFFADQPCAWFVYHLQMPWLPVVAHDVTQLGLANYYIIACVLLLAIGLALRKARLWQANAFILISIIVSGILCDLFKFIIGRARPYELTLHHIYGLKFFQFSPNFWSLPSGHSTTISAVAVALSYLFPRYWIWFFIVVVLVLLSRILLLMHYPSDVWAGFYLGTLTTIWMHRLLSPKLPQIDKYRSK